MVGSCAPLSKNDAEMHIWPCMGLGGVDEWQDHASVWGQQEQPLPVQAREALPQPCWAGPCPRAQGKSGTGLQAQFVSVCVHVGWYVCVSGVVCFCVNTLINSFIPENRYSGWENLSLHSWEPLERGRHKHSLPSGQQAAAAVLPLKSARICHMVSTSVPPGQCTGTWGMFR